MSVERSNLLAALQQTQSAEKQSASKSSKKASQPGSVAIRALASGNDKSVHNDMSMGDLNTPTPRSHRASSSMEPSKRQQHFIPGQLYPLIPGRLSFTAHESDEHTVQEIQRNPQLFFFSTDLQERYLPFCADFGPVNLGTMVQFCDYVRDKEDDKRLKNRHLVYYCTNDVESVSNTAFLISAYLMLEHRRSPDEAVAPFTNLVGIPIVPFRDPTYVKSTFHLSIKDCLCGLRKAVEMGWFVLNEFDLEQYEELDHPDNGDMHQICPKFVAFRGPEHRKSDDEDSGASSPEFVAQVLHRLNVDKVVRLNEASTYDKRAFERAGLAHVDLFFDDCTTPPEPLVARFLAEAAGPGRLAVHCLAGLGRTGTLIGVWLMRECGFSAREAIGWLRLVRPGSVIGPQQHYLEWVQARLAQGPFPDPNLNAQAARGQPVSSPRQSPAGTAGPPSPSLSSSSSSVFAPPSASAALSEQLANQVRRAVTKRRP